MTDSLTQPPPELLQDVLDDTPDEVVVRSDAAEGGPPSEPHGGGRLARGWNRFIAMPVEGWLSLTIVAGCVLFTFMQLGPHNLFSDTTPNGGDMGAHVWGPAYLRDHLLPSFRLSGWSPDWYMGFAAYEFYMVVPSLLIALLSFVIPYGVAFKLVAVSGVLTLPVAAWTFGRLNRMLFPVSPLLAVGATAFLFDRSFSIYGGNIPSTLAGEFAFSISLSLAVLYLGVLGRSLETGKHRGWVALLLAVTCLTHIIPFIFAMAGTVVWFLVRPGVARLKVLATTLPVAGLLTAFWTIPFLWDHGYMTDMGWDRKTNYANYLFTRGDLDPQLVNSPPISWLLALAAIGALMAVVFFVVDRQRAGLFWVAMAVVSAVGFRFAPDSRLWNARLLPFFYLSLALLGAIGVAYLGRTIAMLVARDPARPVRPVTWVVGVVAAVAVILALATPLRSIAPGTRIAGVEIATVDAAGKYSLLGLPGTTDKSFIPSWARWNFSGYEEKPAYPEYHDIVQTMDDLGQTNGCGRAMWEHEETHDRYGTPMALMLLPFWTDGCIGSMEGLFFEASATTPYHFLNQDELSSAPSNAMRDLPYVPGAPSRAEFDLGIDHLQMLGVKYYMAISDRMIAFGRDAPELTEVATSGPWVVFEVQGSELVEGLENQPAVVVGNTKGHGWQDIAVPWYQDPTQWSVPLTADGPENWQRIEVGATPEKVPVSPVTVTNIDAGDDTLSFDVDQIGVPVVVKASYHPNWKVSGADGPYRATPNVMVVVPTSTHVELSYGRSPIDLASSALTLLGIVLLVFLFRAGPIVMPEPRPWGRPDEDPVFGPEGGGGPRTLLDPDAPPAPPGIPVAGWTDPSASPMGGAAAGTAVIVGADDLHTSDDDDDPVRAPDPGSVEPGSVEPGSVDRGSVDPTGSPGPIASEEFDPWTVILPSDLTGPLGPTVGSVDAEPDDSDESGRGSDDGGEP